MSFASNPASIKVGIVGLGLIGGSLARALRRSEAAIEIVGVSRRQSTCGKALELGLIDRAEADPARIGPVDVVVLATPLRAMPDIMRRIAPAMGEHTVLTDAGSVKGFVVDAAAKWMGGKHIQFVPGHPIAGTEQSGLEASFAELFDNRTVILTPQPENPKTSVALVRSLWQLTGAQVREMGIQQHDEFLAATSHLPHMVAYALVHYLCGQRNADELFSLAAGGFYDFTRIASSDPVMWRDIALTNPGPLTTALRGFVEELSSVIEALEQGDADALQSLFLRAKQRRDRGLEKKDGRS